MPFVVQQNVDAAAEIAYPIVLPASPSPSITTPHGMSSSAVSESPYDGSQQVQGSPASAWQLEIDYPPMDRDEAEDLIADLLSLNGQFGTFMVGDDANPVPRGEYLAGLKNLLRYSEAFDTGAVWALESAGAAIPTVTPDAVNDDLGALIAEQIDFPVTSAGEYSRLRQDLPYQCGIGRAVAFSVWLKGSVAGPHTIELKIADLPLEYSAAMNAAVTDAWQRFTLAVTFPGVEINPGMSVMISQIAGQAACTIYAAKAQLEYAAAASAYQRRDADPAVLVGVEGSKLLTLNGLTARVRIARKGDWIGVGRHLHKVLREAWSDDAGAAVLRLYPPLRETVQAGDPIYWRSPLGEFRLASDDLPWTIDQASLYGIKIACMEAF